MKRGDKVTDKEKQAYWKSRSDLKKEDVSIPTRFLVEVALNLRANIKKHIKLTGIKGRVKKIVNF